MSRRFQGVIAALLTLSLLAPFPAAAADADFQDLEWEALMPQGWDPMAQIADIALDGMDDEDPASARAMDTMKAVWSNAPSVTSLNGKKVRLPGFIVPLVTKGETVTEFLLVPYFGACIHTPPPPANQMVLIRPDSPVSMSVIYDPVWVSGTIKVERSKNDYGGAAYVISPGALSPYQP